jgi:hypothetical protein
VIDLDGLLRAWITAPAPPWDAAAAQALARRAAVGRALSVEWEPDDEEWVRLLDESSRALVSVRYPLVLTVPELADAFGEPGVRVVPVSSVDAEELRASPDVLIATLLPSGNWDEDFDTEAVSAWDLFVESV